MMKGVFLFLSVTWLSVLWCWVTEHGADGFLVLREVALDFGQIEGAEDARVRFAIKEEFEGLLDQLLRRDSAAGDLLPVFGKDGHQVRGGRLVRDGDLEGCLVHFFDSDEHEVLRTDEQQPVIGGSDGVRCFRNGRCPCCDKFELRRWSWKY
jgi:hypothetical protein